VIVTPALTTRGAATRARIIEGAAQEIREHGVTVTLDDIRARTRTSKSQLFHYFPGGKEQLLLAVAEHEAGRVLADQQPFLGERADWESWAAWRDAVIARYRAQGRQCPLAAIMTEVGRATPAAQAITSALISEWERHITNGVTRMRDAGLVGHSIDSTLFARSLIAGIQGGVALMLATGSFDYLEAALDSGISELRPSARAAGSAR
jgi:AcrR family transcriptional regulator